MFSNRKASSLMLIVPVILLIVVIILSILVVMSLNKPTTTSSQNNTTELSNPQTTPTQDTSANKRSENPQDRFSKALSAIPQNGFPENTCPQGLTEESSGQSFVLDNEKKYSISANSKIWIKANCTDTEILNF